MSMDARDTTDRFTIIPVRHHKFGLGPNRVLGWTPEPVVEIGPYPFTPAQSIRLRGVRFQQR